MACMLATSGSSARPCGWRGSWTRRAWSARSVSYTHLNARLAAKLTSWKIDIKSQSQVEADVQNMEAEEAAADAEPKEE